MHALILHDIKARFFGNGLGWVVTILWPGVHITAIVALHVFKTKTVPYGDNAILFATTGVLPYIVFNYLSRYSMRGIVGSIAFLQYPIVKFFDLITTKILLETITVTIVIFALMIVLFMLQIDFRPHNMTEAAKALAAVFALGAGLGMINGQIVRRFPFWITIYVFGCVIPCYITSGAVVIQPEMLPAQYAHILAWNPLVHIIEWFRSSFYDDYPTWLLSKSYICYLAATTFVLGLIVDRVTRHF